MKKTISILILAIVALFAVSAIAQNKVVVIPLNSAKKLKNVVTVSAKGGDFTDPVAAVSSITDAAEDNPYFVVIGPGVYTLTEPLVMKPWVSIAGAGQRSTSLTGAISTDLPTTSAIVYGADNAIISDLTVENTGGLNTFSAAICNNGAPPIIRAITFNVSGATLNLGVFNTSSSSPTIIDVEAFASGGEKCSAILNDWSSPTITNVFIKSWGGSEESHGIKNISSSPTITNVAINVTGTTHNFGVYNDATSSPTMTNISANAIGGTVNIGIYNSNSSPSMTDIIANGSGGESGAGVFNNYANSSPNMVNVTARGFGSIEGYGVLSWNATSTIRHSTLEGSSAGISVTGVSSGPTKIAQSSVIGGATAGAGSTLTCVSSDNGVDTLLDGTCQ